MIVVTIDWYNNIYPLPLINIVSFYLSIKYYPNFANFRHTIANYYRTRRFKLDIVKYLSRIVS